VSGFESDVCFPYVTGVGVSGFAPDVCLSYVEDIATTGRVVYNFRCHMICF
jgi:hypothetical protein